LPSPRASGERVRERGPLAADAGQGEEGTAFRRREAKEIPEPN